MGNNLTRQPGRDGGSIDRRAMDLMRQRDYFKHLLDMVSGALGIGEDHLYQEYVLIRNIENLLRRASQLSYLESRLLDWVDGGWPLSPEDYYALFLSKLNEKGKQRCACGDEFASGSIGAAFMTLNDGVCEGCHAENQAIQFARVEEFSDLGQVLLVAKRDDERDDFFKVEITFDPKNEALEHCYINLIGIKSEDGARKALKLITRDVLHSAVFRAKDTASSIVADNPEVESVHVSLPPV